MSRATSWILSGLLGGCICFAGPARADDADALALEGAPTPESTPESNLKAAFEFGLGQITQRQAPSTQNLHRASLDLRYSTRLNEAWRLSFSDRLDDAHPAPEGRGSTINSLREIYLGWQLAGAATSVDVGRINLRQGPAFGYNPTDYFRTGALRSITTADPVTLREMRMGSVMARLGQLWPDGGVSLALAPKLETSPDQRAASLDLGTTNNDDRALLMVSGRAGERLNAQGSVLFQRGSSPTVGASITALTTDSLVAYAEWSSGKMPSLLDQVLRTPTTASRTQQAALGLTYTLPSATAITLEAEYNGAGLDRAGWASILSQGTSAYQNYIALTQPSQELGSRRAWLVYLTQKGLGLKQLDLNGFVRTNALDHSGLVWAELRYHWQRFDAAVQLQRSFGSASSEFGVMPYRQVVQLLGVLYL